MRLFKKSFTIILIFLTFVFYLPDVSIAGDKITQLPPEIISTPEEAIPEVIVKNGISLWWYVLGAVVIGGGIAAAGGGGKKSDNSSNSGGSGSTGTTTITW